MSRVRDAATVVLLRDAPDLHVLMLRRSTGLEFVPGAHVFPGGAVDPGDRDDRIAALVVGLDDRTASGMLHVAKGGLGVWVAAVREAFEEADILLLRDGDTVTDPAGGGTRIDTGAFSALRTALNRGEASAYDLMHEVGGRLHASDLHLFAHFVTPSGISRRYDTWFFAAEAPHGQMGSHDDDETVHSEWVAPAEMLARGRDGEVDLIAPTAQTLALLGRYARASDFLAELAAAQPQGQEGMSIVRDGWGERVLLPGDPPAAEVQAQWTQPLVPPRTPRPFGAGVGEEGVA